MKRILAFVVIVTALVFNTSAFASGFVEVKGRIKDAVTGEPLSGATVVISDLKVTTVSNRDGEFNIKNLPNKGKFLLEVRYVGYKAMSKLVDLSNTQDIEFSMEPSVIESAEVVITGTPFSAKSKHSSLAVVTANRDKLTQSGSSNLIEALAKLPGISQVSTGTAISKPSIRGLGFNRVLTIVDGAREEAQQWGEEHGVQVDQFSAARVEVLKGPASLLYGSDALGGVINIVDDYVPSEGVRNGNFTTNYSTNNGLTGSSLMFQGNENGFVYRARGSYKNAHGFRYNGITVPNSGFNESNLSGMIGLNKAWGYSHLSVSHLNTNIGLVEEGPEEDGHFHAGEGISSTSRKLMMPYQNIKHFRAALNSNFLIGGGQLKSTFAFQRNNRIEFEEHEEHDHHDGAVHEEEGHGESGGLNMELNSFTYDVKYALGGLNNWDASFGLQGMFQQNANIGQEFLIPDYSSRSIGVFSYAKRSFNRGAVNLGLRYDYKTLNGKALTEDGSTRFNAFDNQFSNLSASFGLAYDLTDALVFKANAGSGFRAPNIAELGSNGRHHGTFRYEIGNANLKQENSAQFDLGLEYNAKIISIGINAFSNRIFNYVYASQQNGETIEVEHGDHHDQIPVFRFIQTDADLIGGEATVDFHLIKSLHFENSFSYVKATNRDTKRSLPFIPAANIVNEISFEPNLKGLKDSFIKLSFNHVFDQNRFDTFETKTEGYTLIDAGIGTSFATKKSAVKVWLTAQNLGDKLYFNHLSRYKPVGIYNPGRNFSFGISVPL